MFRGVNWGGHHSVILSSALSTGSCLVFGMWPAVSAAGRSRLHCLNVSFEISRVFIAEPIRLGFLCVLSQHYWASYGVLSPCYYLFFYFYTHLLILSFLYYFYKWFLAQKGSACIHFSCNIWRNSNSLNNVSSSFSRSFSQKRFSFYAVPLWLSFRLPPELDWGLL